MKLLTAEEASYHKRELFRLASQLVANDAGARELRTAEAPPDPYAPHLEKMRAASATPESTFEDTWKVERRAALDRTTAEVDTQPPTPRLTNAELAKYRAPDPYAEPLRALREGR